MKKGTFIFMLMTLYFTASAQNMGIGTDNPTAKLDVNGQIRIRGGNPGVGKVLTSDSNGVATWQSDSRLFEFKDSTRSLSSDNPDTLIRSSQQWAGGKTLIINGQCSFKTWGFETDQFTNFSGRVEVLYKHPMYGIMHLNGASFQHTMPVARNEKAIVPINVIIPFPTVAGPSFSILVYQGTKKWNGSTWVNTPIEVNCGYIAVEF